MIRLIGGAYILISGCSIVLFSLMAKIASTVAESVVLGIVGTLFSSVVFVLGAALIMDRASA